MEECFLSSHAACRVARAITHSVCQGCPNGLLRGNRFGGNTGGVAQLVPNMIRQAIWKCQGWSQGGHKVVKVASSLLPPCTKYQGCLVTRLSQGCSWLNIVTRLFMVKHCHKVATPCMVAVITITTHM